MLRITPVDKSMRRQCSSTESSHPAAERPPSNIPLSLPPHCQLAYLISKATPTPIPRSRSPSRFTVDCTGHAPVSARICTAICLRGSYLRLYGERTRAEKQVRSFPGWSNPNNRRTLNERGPGRVSFPTRHFSSFPGNLIVHVESKGQASEHALIWEEPW